jgi:hypothetical protein
MLVVFPDEKRATFSEEASTAKQYREGAGCRVPLAPSPPFPNGQGGGRGRQMCAQTKDLCTTDPP